MGFIIIVVCCFIFMLTINFIVNFRFNVYVLFIRYMFIPLNFIFSTEEFLLQISREVNFFRFLINLTIREYGID